MDIQKKIKPFMLALLIASSSSTRPMFPEFDPAVATPLIFTTAAMLTGFLLIKTCRCQNPVLSEKESLLSELKIIVSSIEKNAKSEKGLRTAISICRRTKKRIRTILSKKENQDPEFTLQTLQILKKIEQDSLAKLEIIQTEKRKRQQETIAREQALLKPSREDYQEDLRNQYTILESSHKHKQELEKNKQAIRQILPVLRKTVELKRHDDSPFLIQEELLEQLETLKDRTSKLDELISQNGQDYPTDNLFLTNAHTLQTQLGLLTTHLAGWKSRIPTKERGNFENMIRELRNRSVSVIDKLN